MQRQAVPLMNPEAPFVGTGMEHVAAETLVLQLLLSIEGRVEHVESNEILVRRLVEENGTEHEGELDRYPLRSSSVQTLVLVITNVRLYQLVMLLNIMRF